MAYTTIDDPSKYFQTAIWTGDGNDDRSITFDGNSDLQPDMVWTKRRPTASSHGLRDSTRGATVELFPDATDDEATVSDRFQAFESDGFQVGTNADINGTSNNTYVAWAWKANGGTVANDTNGDITTSVQASQTAGFSIATYTGNGGSGQTLGHGLGAEADIVIFKDRESASAWRTYVRLLGASKFLNLDTTDAANTSSNIFPSASSTTIGVEQNDVMNKNNSDFVMYSFRSIQGYSKIGKYIGNGSEDGPFVYTGFKPRWILFKNTGAAEEWVLQDTKRNPDNPVTKNIRVDSSIAEADASNIDIDFLSNGFKNRSDQAQVNSNGVTYIYMAFAESPFVSSTGVPTTAR